MKLLWAAGALLAVVACDKGTSAPPPGWEPDRSCVSSEECRPVPSCCPTPCTSDVVNVRDLPKVQSQVDVECKKSRGPCPVAGSCPGHKYLCVRKQCALVMEGSPDWPDGG